MGFQDEKLGRSFRLAMGGTYRPNEGFSMQAKGALEARQRRARALARSAAGAGDSAAAVQGRAGVILATSNKFPGQMPVGMSGNSASAQHARSMLVSSPHIGPANPSTYPGHAGVGGVVPPQGPGGEHHHRAAAAQLAEQHARRAVMASMNLLHPGTRGAGRGGSGLWKEATPPSADTASDSDAASSADDSASFTLGKSKMSVASSSTPALAEIFAAAGARSTSNQGNGG